MRIPQEIIEDIKFRNPIEDVISSYMTLTRAGRNMKGLCPFHSEKTPSFTVYTESRSFYCFGCGAGGDVISFVMKTENLDYPAAIEFLAKRVGITLPEDTSGDFFNKGLSRSRTIEMNTCAARFFRDVLFDDEMGKPAREYLAKRKLALPIIKRFGLGYAPDGFHALRDHLRKNGFTDEEMTEGYFCGVSKKNQSLYDYFRGRLMFPLIDVAGNVVAFGGRILTNEKPKYINTSDTPAFKKSKMLFGLNFAKNTEEDHLILCEGNIDVVSLHQAGIENAVATLGTSITAEHARLMRKYTSKVCITYDGDLAGQNATEKAIGILEAAGLETRIVEIPGGQDPDDYIRQYGKEAFMKLVEGAKPKFDFELKRIISKNDTEDTSGKVKAAREICERAAAIHSMVERELFIGKAAKELGVDRKSIEHDVSAIIRRNNAAQTKTNHEKAVRDTSKIGDRVNLDYAKNLKIGRLEEMVLGMMLCCPELISKGIKKEGLTLDDFSTDYGKRLFSIVEGQMESFDIALLNEEMTPEEVSRAVMLMTARQELKNTDDIFAECVAALKAEVNKKNSSLNLQEILKRRREEEDKK